MVGGVGQAAGPRLARTLTARAAGSQVRGWEETHLPGWLPPTRVKCPASREGPKPPAWGGTAPRSLLPVRPFPAPGVGGWGQRTRLWVHTPGPSESQLPLMPGPPSLTPSPSPPVSPSNPWTTKPQPPSSVPSPLQPPPQLTPAPSPPSFNPSSAPSPSASALPLCLQSLNLGPTFCL